MNTLFERIHLYSIIVILLVNVSILGEKETAQEKQKDRKKRKIEQH